MKIITSVTLFNDAVGLRMSATYSTVDDTTGRVVSDNQRFDRVVTDAEAKASAQALLEYAAGDLKEE